MIQYNILFRACDKVESVHKARRPFNLNKNQVIKISFYSIYESLQGHNYKFTIIGDDLSKDLQDFFSNFKDVVVLNEQLGNASKSLQRQIELAEVIPDKEWVYMLEDDYLHTPDSFKIIDEFIINKNKILETSRKKKNYMNFLVGNLAKKSLIIHTPDYPDRYFPQWKRHSYIFLSEYCHWRQISNTTHTFLLEASSIKRFNKEIKASAVGPSDSKLSEKVYGRIFLKNRALCVSPIKGLSTHMTEGVMTPFVDWEKISHMQIDKLKSLGYWSD